jgi:hypothetical protein
MRLAAPVLLVWLVAGVCGDGLRASFEKLMLFNSYQIDQLLPREEQTIGIKCAEKPLRQGGPCPEPADPNSPKYIYCEVPVTAFDNKDVGGSDKRPCKYLWEFLGFIDGKDYKGQDLIRGTASGVQNKLDFDIDDTAKHLNERGFDKAHLMWRVYKDTASAAHIVGGQRSYNGMLSSVFDSVASVKGKLSNSDYEGNKHLFERFDASSLRVAETRMADYHMTMMAEIQKREPDIKLASDPLGFSEKVHINNQVRELRIFNEADTIEKNQDTMPDVEKRLNAQIEAFKNNKQNKSHLALIHAIVSGANYVERTTRSCT